MWEKLRLCTFDVQLNGYLCWENKEEGIKGILKKMCIKVEYEKDMCHEIQMHEWVYFRS